MTSQPSQGWIRKAALLHRLPPLKGHRVCHEVNLLSPLKACESGRRGTCLLLIGNAERGGIFRSVRLLVVHTANNFYAVSPMNTRVSLSVPLLFPKRKMCSDVVTFILPQISNCLSCLSEQKTRPYDPSSFLFVLNMKHFCKLMCRHVSIRVLSPKWSPFEESQLKFTDQTQRHESAVCWDWKSLKGSKDDVSVCVSGHWPCGKWKIVPNIGEGEGDSL